MKPTLKYGDKGPFVKELQILLKKRGASLSPDGHFGMKTLTEVRKFQKTSGLNADGVVGSWTWNYLEKTRQSKFHDCVDRYIPLEEGQYRTSSVQKYGATIHHTVSDGDPEKVVNIWNRDARGAVGTHFLIGRKMDNGNMDFDGEIIQTMDLIGSYAHHIATTRTGFSRGHSNSTNKLYIGIEICSWGYLQLGKDGKFRAASGKVIPKQEVEILETPWRTFKYWHKYTPGQIESLRKLLLAIEEAIGERLCGEFDPPINREWYDLSWNALRHTRRLTIHSNFEYGKFDAYPSELMTKMLKGLYS